MDKKKFTREVNNATYFTVIFFFLSPLVKNKKVLLLKVIKLMKIEWENSLFNNQES